MSSTPDPIFIADYEYTSKYEGELNFTVGDRVIILKTDGDWLYGRHTITHTEGWLPLSYGHIRKISPYVSLDTVLKLSKRQELLESSKVIEKEFVDSLHELFDKVINPLQLRDTVFKRNFLSNGRVALSFNLLADIQKACSNFLVSLETSRKDAEIADAYLQFAPSLQLFAQYCSENPALLNTIQQNSKGLTPIIGKFNLIESIISPLQHYSTYQHNFQEFVWLTIDTDNDAMNNIEIALDIITAQSEYVNAKLKQESEHMRLLTLQNQFIGNPSIFNADRKLLRESEIELVKIKINGDHQITSYYAHLFNDALIYSSQSVISGNFKLCGMIELQGATFQIHELGGTKTGFSLSKRETPEQFEHFKLPNEEQTIDWFSVIIQQIEELEKVKAKQSGSTPIIDQFINTVDVGTLGPRCSLIFKLLNSEKQFAELLSALNTTFIRPLIDASKGAVLRAVPSHECNTVTDSITISKYERELITEALQEADIPIFLHAAEGISNSLKDFISFLEILCQSNWTEGLLIGNFFLSVNALTLYDRLKSYSSSQPAMLRVLKNPIFTNFQKDVEGFLTHLPGTLLEKLEFPQKRIMVYISILSDIQKVTLSSHSDYSSLTIALNKLNTVEQEIIESVKSKKNFEKLLEIQSSLITILTEPIIEKLVTMERKFLKEGDLMKVCRRKNKLFRFWLFNDYLIYASSLGGDKYSFNRALELNKCSIQTYNSNELKNAFEIIGEEKSFILIAPSNIIYEEWFNAIKKITQSFQGIRKESILQESAPLSKPNQSDQNCDECTQCHKPFTFWNRRHHCHKCDAFVCNNHLNNREIIPHISKTQKQKICDNCFSGKTIMVTPTKAMDNVGVSKISDISTVGKKIVTTSSLQQQKSYESEKRDPVELKANRLPMKAKLVGSNPFTDDLSQASLPGIESIVVTRKEESTSVPPIAVVPPVSSLKSKVENDANSMPITRPPPPPPPPPPPARAQPLIKLELLPLSPGKQFHVFLTHNWSDDLHGRNNHSRVARVNQGLKQRGFITWFDEERMTGHIRQTMANALYQSMSVAVFITRIYENKINSNNHADNCLYEFNATSNHSILVNTRLAIGMETMMLNPRNWIDGRLKAELGGELIIDMTNDEDDIFEKQCDVLADRLRAIVVFSE